MENKLQFFDVEQGTPEWLALRDLVLTGSNAATIAVGGKGLETYVKKLAQEHYSTAEKTSYQSDDMKRGNELEPIARSIYELESGNTVEQIGFAKINEYVGVSPDGLIGEDGGFETKAPSDKTYFEYLLDEDKEPDPDYVAQCRMCMYVTGRKWWVLQYFNPNYSKSTKVWKIEPDTEFTKKLEAGLAKGIELIKSIKEKLEHGK
jgi:predicted phage-related endonuclease